MIRLWSTLLLVVALSAVAMAQEMSKEQWQQEMNTLTQQANDLRNQVSQGNTQVSDMQGQSTKLDADLQKCLD